MPTGVASTGTSQASASSTDKPKPSRSEGTSTQLAALIQSATLSGGTPPSVSSSTPAARASESARSWRFSLRAGSAGNSRYGPAAWRPSSCRADARGSGRKRASSTPHGSTSARFEEPRPGSALRSGSETAARRSIEGRTARVASRVRGWLRSVPWTVSARTRAGTASAGQAVSPKCA